MKIAIFYHIFQLNNWKEIFKEQISTMKESGLWDASSYIHFGINKSSEFEVLPAVYDPSKINMIKYNRNNNTEADTLTDLWYFCQKNPDYKVLYLHTKGVSHIDTWASYEAVESWRKYLEFFNLKNWASCCSKLDSYDCAGTEWIGSGFYGGEWIGSSYYGGNFWWSNAKHINRLHPIYFWRENGSRWNCETWLSCDGTLDVKAFSFCRLLGTCEEFERGMDFYHNVIPPEKYENTEVQER